MRGVPPAGNSGRTAGRKAKPPRGKPFVAGDPRINREGRPPLPEHLRLIFADVAPEYVPRLIEALTVLVERGGKDAAIRGVIGQQLLESLAGKPGPQGWLEKLFTPKPSAPSDTAPQAGTDLAQEIANARAKAADLEAQLREMGETAAPDLRKAYNEAVDLVRRLCATQAEYNPGGDAHGDFVVELEVKGSVGDAGEDVPDLVADRVPDDAAPVSDAAEPAPVAAGGTGNPIVDGVSD